MAVLELAVSRKQKPPSKSRDELLWNAYESGDPYIAFAIQAGIAPPGATKETRKDIRNRCKSVVLGTNYGMTSYGVAQAAKIH